MDWDKLYTFKKTSKKFYSEASVVFEKDKSPGG